MFRTGQAMHLPTEVGHLGLCEIGGTLQEEPIGEADYERAKFQYLYIVTKDPINTGDWFQAGKDMILKCTDGNLKSHVLCDETKTAFHRTEVKKIIVSTDKSLGLPLPSDNFIRKYANHNGIVEVKVYYYLDTESSTKGYKPLLDDENRAIIKTYKVTYTTDEVVSLLHAYREYGWKNGMALSELNGWINLNI